MEMAIATGQSPEHIFDLGNTIKRQQALLVKDAKIKANAQLNAKSMKQDDLLARKDRSVVSKSISTVPEKTLY